MTSNDPLAPRSSARDAFAGPIACITLLTDDAEATDKFYSGVLEMERDDARESAEAEKRELWALPESFAWSERVYWRPGLPEVARLRVLASPDAGTPVRPGLDSLLEGGLSIGFAMRDLEAVVARGARLGFETTAGVGALDMQRADGSPYQALECHFHAPDDVYALGVGRPPDLAPVGPIESAKTVGAPSYTGQVMNHCDETMRFFIDVLGYEVRRDMKVGGPIAEKGLGLPAGTMMRFMQVFAPGSTSSYFIVLDFEDAGKNNAAVAPPHRGVVMWTIPVRDVGLVAASVGDVGCEVVAGPISYNVPGLGNRAVVSVRTQNGFLVECVQMDDD